MHVGLSSKEHWTRVIGSTYKRAPIKKELKERTFRRALQRTLRRALREHKESIKRAFKREFKWVLKRAPKKALKKEKRSLSYTTNFNDTLITDFNIWMQTSANFVWIDHSNNEMPPSVQFPVSLTILSGLSIQLKATYRTCQTSPWWQTELLDLLREEEEMKVIRVE